MTYGSVCSGIEAATAAWRPLGWKAKFFAEIDPFCRAVLHHHYPETKCYGDFTKLDRSAGPIDVLVGGTPCQAFSIAGLRRGLADDRGNLTLEFLKLAQRLRPRWLVWENVPGVFSSTAHDAPDFRPPDIDLDASDGPVDGEEILVEDQYDADESHAFSCFLAGLQELGYGFAYRVLDAQFFGVPQRRRRVFVVGCLGDWRSAAAVLLERESLSGYPPPSRETGEGSTHATAPSLTGSGRGVERAGESRGQDPVVAMCLNAKGGAGRNDGESETFVPTIAPCLTQNYGKQPDNSDTSAGPMLIPILEAGARTGKSTSDIRAGIGIGDPGDPMFTLQSGKQHAIAIGLDEEQNASIDSFGCLKARTEGGGFEGSVMTNSAVRRLLPEECEKLQGFQPGYTNVPYRGKPAADGPRYKALGNSMAVPCMAWIGSRIQAVEQLKAESEAA